MYSKYFIFVILIFLYIILLFYYKFRSIDNIESFYNSDRNYQLGCAYSQGNGVVKDDNKSLYYFKLSASQGNKDAANKLQEINNKKESDKIEFSKPSISFDNQNLDYQNSDYQNSDYQKSDYQNNQFSNTSQSIVSNSVSKGTNCMENSQYFKGRRIVWKNLKLNGSNINNYVWTNEKMTISGDCIIYSSNYQSFNNDKFQILIGLKDNRPVEVYNEKTETENINTSKCYKNTDCTNLGINNINIGNNKKEWSCDNNICKLNCLVDSDCVSGGLSNDFKCINNKCLKPCNNNKDCSRSDSIGGYKCISEDNNRYCSVDSSGKVIIDNKISSNNPYYLLNTSKTGANPYSNTEECRKLASIYPVTPFQNNSFQTNMIAPPGSWLNSASNIKINRLNNKNNIQADLEINNIKKSSSVNYESGLSQQSYSNINGNFTPDVTIETKKVCKKEGFFQSLFGESNCHNKIIKTPLIVKQDNPQNIWNKEKCTLQSNKVYKFSFNVSFYPQNYQFGNIPIYIAYALTDTDKNLLKKNNYYVKMDSSFYNNEYFLNNNNINILTNINIKQKYKYISLGYTSCNTPCQTGTKQEKFRCKNIKENIIENNNSNCSGLPFNTKVLECNKKNCYYQPDIQNLVCYISISQKDDKNTYKNTEKNRLGVRDFNNFENKKKLQINPYYKYTRTFTSSSDYLSVKWIIRTKKKYDKNHIQEAYIYSPDYDSYLTYTKEMYISIISKEHLNDECLWEIKSDPLNTPVYYIKHIKTQKYLYSTYKMENYIDQYKYDKIKNINTGDVKEIDYRKFGEISCSNEKQNKWFIVPIEPLEIKNRSYNYINNICKKNNMRLANKKEFSEFSKIGGVNKDLEYWTSNIYPAYYETEDYYNNCMEQCKISCTDECLPLLFFWPSYIGCTVGCVENNCPLNCEYLSRGNVQKNKDWYKSDITDINLGIKKRAWVQPFNDGKFNNTGNHNEGIYSGICIQNPDKTFK